MGSYSLNLVLVKENRMYTLNPYEGLSIFLPAIGWQIYACLMIFAVIIGTLWDLYYGRKLEFFKKQRSEVRQRQAGRLTAGQRIAAVAKAIIINIATTAEFQNKARRTTHLLGLYGFVIYLISSLLMIFLYPTSKDTPIILPIAWNLGALMVVVGGLWFFLRQRVNVSHEGNSPWQIIRADLFISMLILSSASALIMELSEMSGSKVLVGIFFGLYMLFTTLLFTTVRWSKLAHMFYKAGLAIQKRLDEARGISDLPIPILKDSDK
jgi:hypothetical protein